MSTGKTLIGGWTNGGRPATWADVRAAISRGADRVRIYRGDSLLLALSRPVPVEVAAAPVAQTQHSPFDVQQFINGHNLIRVPGMALSIMQRELTIRQFVKFVQTDEYEIVGDSVHSNACAKALATLLTGPEQDETAMHLSLADGRAYAKWLTGLTQGQRSFKVPTQDEWLAAVAKIKDQLLGESWSWEWLDTNYNYSDWFILRSMFGLDNSSCLDAPVYSRSYESTIRLVEVLK